MITRRFATHAEVNALVDLFRKDGGTELFKDAGFEDELRLALRTTLLSGFEFATIGDEPRQHHFRIDMLRDDIRVSLEAFETIESASAGIGNIQMTDWPWPEGITWTGFRATYDAHMVSLRDPSTSIQDRYATLVSLIRLEVLFWGVTFGICSGGYIGFR